VSQSGAPWGVVSGAASHGVWCSERHPMGCGVWTTKKKALESGADVAVMPACMSEAVLPSVMLPNVEFYNLD
jgi:hypothetical protein